MECNIFKLDNSTIDVLKVVTELWRNRKNEDLVKGLAETLASFAVEKKTLWELEFYMPQLAPLILHLEAQASASQALEYLAISIAQASIQCALHLSYYLSAALEDYQPELKTGAVNPKANLVLYYRAARLLQNVQRAVVYGTPVLTSEQERFMTQQFSQATLDEMFESEKSEAAGRIVRSNMSKAVKMGVSEGVSGRLFFRAPGSTGTGSWTQHFCKVDQRVLFFFKDNMANAIPMRTVPLEGCEVAVVPNPPQPVTFTVTNKAQFVSYTLRASDQADLASWVRFLSTEATRAPQPATDSPLTEGQAKRHLYWTQMQAFVASLVGLSERVRQRPVDVRKFYLRKYLADLPVPPLAYLPWQHSLDRFKYVLKTQPCESSVSNFAAAAPCAVVFETEQHPRELDLATFLSKELQEYSEDSLRAALPPPPSDLVLDRPSAEEDGSVEQPMIVSALTGVAVRPYWTPDGSAMDGLEERFVTPTSGNKGRESITPPVPETVAAARKPIAPATSTAAKAKTSTNQICNAFFLNLREFETVDTKAARTRSSSPAGHLANWKLSGLVAASNIDARQEALVAQLVTYYARVFEAAGLPVSLQSSKVVPVTKNAAVAEFVGSAYSLATIKRHCDYPGSLRVYFEKAFGGTSDAPQFKLAVDNFVGSMAAYSVVCYLLGIRGRSDENVFLDAQGRVSHSDFSAIFKAPSVSTPLVMHDAPFVLSHEMVEVMNGRFSPEFAKYASLCGQCLNEARKHLPVVKALLEIASACADLPAVTPAALVEFEKRHIMGTPDFSVEYEFNFLIERALTQTK